MATMNFSVPDPVKKAFNQAFSGENKSAVISRLMQQAVEERSRARRRRAAIDALLDLRRKNRPVSAAEAQEARDALRS